MNKSQEKLDNILKGMKWKTQIRKTYERQIKKYSEEYLELWMPILRKIISQPHFPHYKTKKVLAS